MFDSSGPGFVSTSPEQHNAVFDSSGPGFVSTSPEQHNAVFDSSGPGFVSTSPEQYLILVVLDLSPHLLSNTV